MEELENNNKANEKSKISFKDKMLLTFIRLRCCLSYRFLSWLFEVSISSVAKYIQETLEIIHRVQKENFLDLYLMNTFNKYIQ